MVTLIDLSPERLVTKPIWVLRWGRWPSVGVGMGIANFGLGISSSGLDLRVWRISQSAIRTPKSAMGSGGSSGSSFLLVGDGLEARDVLAKGAQLVGFLHLAGLLAQLELEELLARLAELGGD